MEKIKEELKLMQTNPNFYLANYFHDFKTQVDLTFFGKEGEEKVKYLEIINSIEDIEQRLLQKYSTNSIHLIKKLSHLLN